MHLTRLLTTLCENTLMTNLGVKHEEFFKVHLNVSTRTLTFQKEKKLVLFA